MGFLSGDTYLRLYETNGTQVAANDDDPFCTISGLLSFISYTKNTIGCASFALHIGCYGSSLCTNHLVMEYTMDSPSSYWIQHVGLIYRIQHCLWFQSLNTTFCI